MKKIICFLVFLVTLTPYLWAQETFPLYPDSIPNSLPLARDTPTITVYQSSVSSHNGAALIIFPGGGYAGLMTASEGMQTVQAFSERGVTCFLIKYRLPSDATMGDKSFGPLMDAEQSIRWVRQHAKHFNIDPARVGIIGFSAGGHLASSLETHYSKSYIPNPERTSLRPDFAILIYPVISMTDSLTHMGSRDNLLGSAPDKNKIKFWSNEYQVTQDSPPTYLTQTGDDQIVTVQNSIAMYQALLQHGVPAELHLYPKGNHCFTLSLPVSEWVDPIILFLKKQNMIR